MFVALYIITVLVSFALVVVSIAYLNRASWVDNFDIETDELVLSGIIALVPFLNVVFAAGFVFFAWFVNSEWKGTVSDLLDRAAGRVNALIGRFLK